MRMKWQAQLYRAGHSSMGRSAVYCTEHMVLCALLLPFLCSPSALQGPYDSTVGLSRTFILIGSGAGGHDFLADICLSEAFHYKILNFFLLSGHGSVILGLHDVFSLLQLSATRNTRPLPGTPAHYQHCLGAQGALVLTC